MSTRFSVALDTDLDIPLHFPNAGRRLDGGGKKIRELELPGELHCNQIEVWTHTHTQRTPTVVNWD